MEWYQYPEFLEGRGIPFEFRVLSTKYISDTPADYKYICGDGDVFVIKNPQDTSVYVILRWYRIKELEPLVREYWYGDIEEIFFSVEIRPPLRFPEDKGKRIEMDKARIKMFFYLPDLPLIDSLSRAVGWLDPQFLLRMIRLSRCRDGSACSIRITRDDRSGHVDGATKPMAYVEFFLAPHDSVVVYVSPIYGR